MLILLPPSEAKAVPRRGRPVGLAALGSPELTGAREAVAAALLRASARPDALAQLQVPPGAAAEVAGNLTVLSRPAAPAASVYTGVLYAALDWAGLSPEAQRRGRRRLRIQSALWGPVGPADRIAPYRLSMGVTLPGLGPLAAFWRARLGSTMAGLAAGGVVVDCRSSTYAAAWRPTAEVARRTVAVRVFTELDGRRIVVSHAAKHTRGLVARWLLDAERSPRTPWAVAAVVADHARCDLVDLGARGWALDVLLAPPAGPPS